MILILRLNLKLRFNTRTMKNEQIEESGEREIILIAAMSQNRVIGRDNGLPWNVRGNLARFKEMTMGWPCIMGRKTWESLPKKPLPGRLNIVVSKTLRDLPESGNPEGNVKVCASIPQALEFCKDYKKIFICGGGSVYAQALPLADKIDLTLIPGNYDGDVFFPEIDPFFWKKDNTVNFDNYSIIIYIRIRRAV